MSDVDCNDKGGVTRPAPSSGNAGSEAPTISHATSTDELTSCYSVIAFLRPHLAGPADWCARAFAMRTGGYRVLVCRVGDEAIAIAGYRITENLIHGRFLYVDDLIVSPKHRGRGLGARLLSEMSVIAQQEQCKRLVLDTAATNLAAQRFYHREGLQAAIIGFVKAI